MVGIQTFLADGNKVAISQERQYAKVWTQEDCHLCHKLSKPGLLIIVSLLAIHSPWCSDRQSCDSFTTHPHLLYCSSSLWLQNIFCYNRCVRPYALYRFAPRLQNGITIRTSHECPCDRLPTMALSETATSDNCLYCCLAVPLSGFGNVRVMPFCPPLPLLPLINCFTIFLLLYKSQFLSTQAYWMWQTCLLRPIFLSVLWQGQGTFVMLTRVPDLSVAQLSLLSWYSLLSTS